MLPLLTLGANVQAGNLTRGGVSTSPATAGGSTAQAATTATSTTAQASQSAGMAQLAQVSLQRSTAALQVMQALQNAQGAARSLALSSTSGNLGTGLVRVPDGININGLLPGVAGIDPSTSTSLANSTTTVAPTVNANGTASITLAADSAITLSPSASGSSQITVSGTGTVGTITTGGTITPLTAGVSTTVPAGSTISLTTAGTVTFSAGSAAIPATLSTYSFTAPVTTANPSGTSSVPSSWTGISGLTQSTYAPGSGQTTGQTTDTVTQTSQQAVLQWQSFNIGKNTTLDFDQSAGGANVANWVAINEIAANIAPTQVLGAIQAPGQVYVINQNGIIFGGSSQVNVHALVASALPINPTLVANGLLNNTTDYSYLFSSLENSSGSLLFTPGSTPQADGNGNTSVSTGGVTVQAGAQLMSPTTPENVGGKIALIGPTVENDGFISTPDGQAILAAGLQVGFKAHDKNDPTLRGLDVYLGAALDPSSAATGSAINGGIITADRGDVTMAGANITQNGVIDSSTSVSLNGRIDLLANYGSVTNVNSNGLISLGPTLTGTATFGANSITDILLDGELTFGANGVVTYTPPSELPSTDTIVGSQLAESSIINVQALTINMQSGSLVWAPSAALPTGISPTTDATILAEDDFGNDLTAGVTFNAGNWVFNGTSFVLVNNAGTINLASGSAIDVSGSENVSASVLENIVTAQLRGTELANSPVQQNGALRGSTVVIDISQYGTYDGVNWIGSPIGDLSGYAGLVQHTVGELTTAGGAVALKAGQTVNVASGADINVSGGWINYAGANVQTTDVVTSSGQLLNISQATPNLIYSGISQPFTTTSLKWGVTQSYNSIADASQYEQGYVQGGGGGALSITAPTIALQGSLLGDTVAGIHQQLPQPSLPTTFGSTSDLFLEQSIYGVPSSSTLTLSFTQQTITGTSITTISPTPAAIVFQPGDGTGTILANPFAGDGVTQVVNLPANLVSADGFGNLKLIDGDGDIAIPSGVTISAAPGGDITFQAANIDIQGNVTANGNNSQLNFSAYLTSPYSDGSGPTSRGNFTLGANSVLDVSGLISDNLAGSSSPNTVPLLTSGGSVDISAYNINLATGSLINVSGGISVSAADKQTFGSAGSITIQAGEDVANLAPSDNPDGSQLFLGATLEGFSGLAAGAGKLSIQAPLIQIGGTGLVYTDTSLNAVSQEGLGVSGDGTTLILSSGFFSQGGFGKISLTALGEVNRDQTLPSLLVVAGTSVDPIVQSWLASTNQDNDVVLTSMVMPSASERAPIQLTLNAPGIVNPANGNLLGRGTVVLDTGSSITTDPLGSVSISGDAIAILGDITAPGGNITITSTAKSESLLFGSTSSGEEPLVTVDIAGSLSVAGVTELTQNSFGLRTGSVLAGGTISITGNIVGESSASLNVGGTSDVLDFVSSVGTGASILGDRSTEMTLDSNGGSISLTGVEELYWDGKLSGAAGGNAASTSAVGGSLTVSSGFFGLSPTGQTILQNPVDPTLVVTGSGDTIQSLGSTVLGNTVQGTLSLTYFDTTTNTTIPIYSYFSASTFDGSGLSSLTLGVGNNKTVEFDGTNGPVTLTADQSISVGSSGYIIANGTVNLTAPLISLGSALPTPAAQQSSSSLGDVFQNSQNQDYFLAPTYSESGLETGTLNVNASELTDIGYLSLQGIGTLNINQGNAAVDAGDVRGAGILDVAGNINIAAAQIYPTTENTFTIAAYLNAQAGSVNSGNIVISGPTGATPLPPLPYSAGGTLNIYADNIEQGGVLRAPIGTINLGAAASTSDLLSGTHFDQASSVSLLSGSVTSVSAFDPTTGLALIIPYGQNLNGTEWVDPAGNNITAAGNGTQAIPAKAINIVGTSIADDKNATIDVTGGGNLLAYTFVSGTGGTVDVLNTTAGAAEGGFAIIPGYTSPYAPVDPTAGYASGRNLSVGERIYLDGSSGLPAGYYTLLPARYALLPGAFLITPTSTSAGVQAPSVANTDGSSTVSGFVYSGLGNSQPAAPASGYVTFNVASASVVSARAEYQDSYATTFLSQSAAQQNQPTPLLPNDAGEVVFNASQSLTFNGTLLGQPGSGGLNSVVEISSSSNILINGTGVAPAGFDGLVLGTSQLDSLNAGSLLIGGTLASNGSTVNVSTNSIEVDDSANPLTGNDITLVSYDSLTLDNDAVIQTIASSVSSLAPSFVVSGDGALLRVSSSPGALTSRINSDLSNTHAVLSIGQGVVIDSASSTSSSTVAAGTLTLDSSNAITLASGGVSPVLSANTLNFNGGLISVVFSDFTGAGNVAPTSGLVLSGDVVKALQQNATNLNILSYSTIDFYGDGTLGANASQTSTIQNLSLQADGIRGYEAVTNATNRQMISSLPQRGVSLYAAKSIAIGDNAGTAFAASSSDPAATDGQLTLNAPVLQLGGGTGSGANNSLTIEGFGQVSVNATQEVLVGSSTSVTNADGSVTAGQATLNVAGANLNMTTPLITGVTGSSEQINVTGTATILSAAGADLSSANYLLGATFGLTAASIADSGNMVFHSGQVTLNATGTSPGNTGVTVNGLIRVSGISPNLQNLSVTKYTNGGGITLTSKSGDVTVGATGELDVSAASGTGTADSLAANAGTLSVSAANGALTLTSGSSLLGQGGVVTSSSGQVLSVGQNGNFSLDVSTIDATNNGGIITSDLTGLEQILSGGAFSQSQTIRIRNDNVEAIDAGSTLNAHSFTLSADTGNIVVDGEINSSGVTGGAINLTATGSVDVSSTAVLTVAGQVFNDAGQGGSVSLNAGAFSTSVTTASTDAVTIAGTINLGVEYLPEQLNNPASSPSSTGDTIAISNAGTTIAGGGTFYLPAGTPGNDTLKISGGNGGSITTNGVTTTFTGSTLSNIPSGSTITLNNPNATISFATGTGGAIPIYLASNAVFTASGATNLTGGAAVAAASAGDVSGTLSISGPALSSNGQVIPLNVGTTGGTVNGALPTSIAVVPITGSITGASSIIVEGNQVYEPADGIIDGTVEDAISQNGTSLVNNTSTIVSNLYQGNANSAALSALTGVEPGAEIISPITASNPTGDLTLQTTWDLSQSSISGGTFHFVVPNGNGATVPGILTLRAAGNLVFDGGSASSSGASLTDGFDGTATGDPSGNLWQAPLLAAGTRSWTYNLVAGADFTAANSLNVIKSTGSTTGNLELGFGSANVDSTALENAGSSGATSSTALLIQFYQTIRSGTGNITIATGNNVQFLDALATIYTAGTQVGNPTHVLSTTYNDFALPNLAFSAPGIADNAANTSPYAAQYSMEGGNVTISALGNILNETSTSSSPEDITDDNSVADSSRELPTSWLDRRGYTQNGVFAATHSGQAGVGEIESTSWWTDFSNFFEGVGALGGGNVTLNAGRSISNVDAVVPTNARMPGLNAQGKGIAPNASTLLELGGGDLAVNAGNDISGGVYYVERGQGTLTAGGSIITNSTRATLSNSDLSSNPTPDSTTWLPTTLFLGKGSFDVTATNSVLLGPVANPFLLPENYDNSFFEKSYFSTYAASDSVNITALTGNIVIKDATSNGDGSLQSWYDNVLLYSNLSGELSWSYAEPWLNLDENINLTVGDPFTTAYTIMPPTLRATAFTGDIDILGSLTLSPSPDSTVDLLASGSINGLQPNGVASISSPVSLGNPYVWSNATVNLSDANPAAIPGIATPLSTGLAPATKKTSSYGGWALTSLTLDANFDALFAETGSDENSLQNDENLHADINGQTLHAGDQNPVQIYAGTGDISGLTLFSGKVTDIFAGQDITDIAFYLQNNQASDVSLVEAGRDILPFDATAPLELDLQNQITADQILGDSGPPVVNPLSGDIEIGGPGSLEVLAGRNFNVGQPSAALQANYSNQGVGFGLISIGNNSDPFLTVSGADIVASAGLADSSGFASPNYSAFISDFLTVGGADSARYLPELGDLLGLDDASGATIANYFTSQLTPAQQDTYALTIFYDVLRDAGRDHNSLGTDYTTGYQAISELFPGNTAQGDMTLTAREIKTESGGDISLLVPGGQLTVGLPVNGPTAIDQGILTVDGGNISIFTDGNVNVGTSRIFTLHGGNEIIWSSNGDIAAGASSKTVQSAPPTRVLVDPQSGNVETDLAGLATGGGIGVLQTVVGAAAADVDLIAPKGTVDAGDAGIRASGNLNIAAVQVINASNISVGGKSTGTPAAAPSSNVAGLSAASSAVGAADSAANSVANNNNQNQLPPSTVLPSIISVEILGYGGGTDD